MRARLAICRDGKMDTAFPITGPRTTIGRQDDNAIQLSDPKVSRHHALITAKGDSWEIFDRGSTNGVKVNGVWADQAVLKNGDKIGIGPFELVFEAVPSDSDWVPSHHIDISPKSGTKTLSRQPEAEGPPPMNGGA